MWTGFVRFRVRLGAGCFDYGNEMKFYKNRSIVDQLSDFILKSLFWRHV
jgi:hypothetical protein